MITQSTRSHEAVKTFYRELGHQLFLCRVQKNMTLSSVARQTGWDVQKIERMEMGYPCRKRFWQFLRLFRFYGKDLCLTTKEAGDSN